MMFSAFLSLSLLGICLATPYKMEMELEPLSDAHISFINKVQSSWTAGRNFEPKDLERVKGLLGVDIGASKRYNKLHPLPISDVEIRDDLPEEFDSRKKWPNCSSIGEIRDQSACGSSWAFGAVEAMTDRMCIHTKRQVHLSAEDLNSCCFEGGIGCRGGFASAAWGYFETQGVVTGGNYNSSKGCMPYSLPNCDHYLSGGKYKHCPEQTMPTPRCTRKCRKGYGKTYEQDKYFGQTAMLFITERQIMQEIVDNGPVTATFNMSSDFLCYRSGVYTHIWGEFQGEHAVKIIGYGVEKGQKYWLAANSWNEDWGDKGFFKIAKGINECGIEELVVAGIPRGKRDIF